MNDNTSVITDTNNEGSTVNLIKNTLVESNGKDVAVTPPDALEYTRREEFTSEIFKLEIKGLPKFFAPGQLKRLLSDTLQLEVRKVKPCGPGKDHCFITFNDNASLLKAKETLNGFKYKGKTLSTVSAPAAPDPLIKLREKKSNEEAVKTSEKEIENQLPIEERVKLNVTPYAHLPYNEQLQKKQEAALNVLRSLGRDMGKVNPQLASFIRWQKLRRKGAVCELDPIIPSPVIDGYRNKCEFTVGTNSDTGAATVGFRLSSYKKGNVSVGPIDQLTHINDTMKSVVRAFEEHVRASPYEPFSPVSHTGIWRQLMVRTSNNNDCLMTVCIHPQKLTDSEVQAVKDSLVNFCETKGKEAGATSLFCNCYGQRDRGVEEVYEHLWGKTHLTETMLGNTFRISPQAFFQVNTAAAERLYTAVGELAAVGTEDVLLDVCCGTGTIGITLAQKSYRMYGMEIVEAAVRDAEHNSSINGLSNAHFLLGNCEHTLPSIFSSVAGRPIKAVVDPPRAGLPGVVMSTLRKHSEVSHLVYLACDPQKALSNFQALTRPISKTFKGQFFVPVRAVAVDLFPHTDKYELIVMFERYDEDKWNQIINGNPRPADQEYFDRASTALEDTPQETATTQQKPRDSAANDTNSSCKRKLEDDSEGPVEQSSSVSEKCAKLEDPAV